MSDEQIQALEALYTAARGRTGTLADLSSVKVAIKTSTLEALRQQGVIGLMGRGLFMLTQQGERQAIENRKLPPAES